MIKRGEIYFIKRRNDLSFGSETAKSRPGIIVSNNVLNATSEVVEVVYLTTQPKKNLPTHVNIDATGTPSVALCEQIDHVSIELLGDYRGTCSNSEMFELDLALMSSLGIETAEGENETGETSEPSTTHDPVNHPSHYTDGKIEVIEFIEDKRLDFHRGNAVKYIARAGKKDPTKTVEDLKKAIWYLTREIDQLEGATHG